MSARSESALSEAAAAFEGELATYARLGKLFLETPLSSVKHLDRANTSLGDIEASEERLRTAGAALAQALSIVRTRQEQLAKEVVARLPAVQARNKQLQDLMAELGRVAIEVQGLNDVIAANGGAAGQVPTSTDAVDIARTVLGLSARSEELAGAARAAEFEEVATQAHALHQRLHVVGKKLQQVGGGGAP